MMILIGIITTGCSSKENPKTILEKNGEKIVILQDRQNPSIYSNLGKYKNELNYIKEIVPRTLGKFLDENRLLIIKRNENDLNNFLLYDLGKEEEILLVSDIEGDVFRLSPEKKKLLFMKNDMEVVVLNLEEKSLIPKTTARESLMAHLVFVMHVETRRTINRGIGSIIKNYSKWFDFYVYNLWDVI
ncbi:MAG: hypothetical protein JJT76_04975 [Clostridiaceae bacterium]|nr:hypothetical protein [Clostridiaceae bacterium]